MILDPVKLASHSGHGLPFHLLYCSGIGTCKQRTEANNGQAGGSPAVSCGAARRCQQNEALLHLLTLSGQRRAVPRQSTVLAAVSIPRPLLLLLPLLHLLMCCVLRGHPLHAAAPHAAFPKNRPVALVTRVRAFLLSGSGPSSQTRIFGSKCLSSRLVIFVLIKFCVENPRSLTA